MKRLLLLLSALLVAGFGHEPSGRDLYDVRGGYAFLESAEGGSVSPSRTWELDGSSTTLENESESLFDGIVVEYVDAHLVGAAVVDGGRLMIEMERAEPDEAIGR